MNFPASLEKRSNAFWVFMGIGLTGVVGLLDFLTGYEIAFSLFYLMPITLVTWFTNRWLGIIASLTSAGVWLIADVLAGHTYSQLFIYIWNTIIRLGFFLIVTFLLSTLRRVLERERALARTDSLTGAVNSSVFYDLLQMEIDRSHGYQHPFTIAYVDLDNFKAVNDRYGHLTGDQVLRTIVNYATKHLRKTDVIARLGGDEFALLMPETNQEAAQVALSATQRRLLEIMRQNNWPITFSIGVLNCIDTSHTREEIVKKVDDLMYTVKREGKNAIKYSIYEG